MPDTSLAESLDYAGSGAKYDKTAKRVMSFKAVLVLTATLPFSMSLKIAY